MLSSFKDSIVLLRKNTLIIAFVFAITLIELPFDEDIIFQIISLSPLFENTYSVIIIVIFSTLIGLLIRVFFDGGIYGTIKEVQEGKVVSFETFKNAGKKYYFLLLKVIIIQFILVVILLGPILYSAITKYWGSHTWQFYPNGPPAVSQWSQILSNVKSALPYFFALLNIPLLFFFHFVDVGVVFNEYSVIESFKESFKFVWRRKLSVLGFFIVTGLISIIAVIPTFLVSIFFYILPAYNTAMNNFVLTYRTEGQFVLYLVGTLIFGTISSSLIYVYKTVYYTQAKKDLKEAEKVKPWKIGIVILILVSILSIVISGYKSDQIDIPFIDNKVQYKTEFCLGCHNESNSHMSRTPEMGLECYNCHPDYGARDEWHSNLGKLN